MMGKFFLIGAGVCAGTLAVLWVYAERGRLLLPSTRKFFQEIGLRNLISLKTLHSYVYVRWTKQYIDFALNYLAPRSDERSRTTWAEHYHGKVLTHDQARAIITLNHTIERRDLEQIIPYPTARDIVLNGPPDVVVYDCVCRKVRNRNCSPLQVCMIVGQPFADLILEHHPKTSRRISQEEALEILEQEHNLGHLHSAWFKDVMLNRFYAICNCCKCCCGGLEGMVKYKMGNISSSGHIAVADTSRCDGCGKCATACPFNAISIQGTALIQWEKCMGCGVCTGQCPNEAITLFRDEKKGLPLDVRMFA